MQLSVSVSHVARFPTAHSLDPQKTPDKTSKFLQDQKDTQKHSIAPKTKCTAHRLGPVKTARSRTAARQRWQDHAAWPGAQLPHTPHIRGSAVSVGTITACAGTHFLSHFRTF